MISRFLLFFFFFFNDTATTEIYTLSLHDALPFCGGFVGYLGWAAATWSERLPQRLGPDPLFPEADLLYASELVAFDHRQGRAWAIASGAGAGADSPEERARVLAERVLAVFG